MSVLHKMFGPDDHASVPAPALAPANDTQGDGGKQVTLIDVLQEADAEKGGDSKVLESAEAGEVGANGAPKEKKPGFFSKVGKFVKKELYSKPVAFWGRSKNAVITTLLLTVVCLVGAVVCLSIVTVHGESFRAHALPSRPSSKQV